MRTQLTALAVLILTMGILVGAGTAAAATAPLASTGPVSAVAPTTATVAGTRQSERDGNELVRRVRDKYGLWNEDPTVSAGAGRRASRLSVALLAQGGNDLSLQVRRDEQCRHRPWRGRHPDHVVRPAAVTGSASNVAATTATLNGTVDPSGRPTAWYFEYGTSTGYGKKTSARDAGSGNGSSRSRPG